MEENNEQIPVVKKISGPALASFICSLVGLIIAGIPCGIAAVVTGILGIAKFKPETQKCRWMAIFGLILGIIDVVLVAIALPAIYKQLGIF